MKAKAEALGHLVCIDCEELVCRVLVSIDCGGGYYREGEFGFTEYDDELFNAVMQHPEVYLDITYQ